jgi:ribonuclease G
LTTPSSRPTWRRPAAIARQLRLRNLGGIIIVDFIDMTREDTARPCWPSSASSWRATASRPWRAASPQLGLVEMTRKRTRESLAHMLCEPCEACQGKGIVKTARSVCYDILREILREARQFNPKEFRVVASAAVVEMLPGRGKPAPGGPEDFIGKPISLQASPRWGRSSTTSCFCDRGLIQ